MVVALIQEMKNTIFVKRQLARRGFLAVLKSFSQIPDEGIKPVNHTPDIGSGLIGIVNGHAPDRFSLDETLSQGHTLVLGSLGQKRIAKCEIGNRFQERSFSRRQ